MDTFDDTYLHVDYPTMERAAEPEPPVSRKPSKRKKARPDDRATALQHAVTGVAAAGLMTSALSASDKPGCGRSVFKPMVVACAALGVGFLCAGILYFLHRRMVAFQASLQATMDEVKKLARLIESSEEIEDEPLPVEEVVPLPQEVEEDVSSNYHLVDRNDQKEDEDEDEDEDENEEEEEDIPRVEELPTPPRPSLKKRVSKKRVSPKAKALVFDLDAVIPLPLT